jgi:sugar/nucleoside kinase (ribokinase family)
MLQQQKTGAGDAGLGGLLIQIAEVLPFMPPLN